MLSEEQNNAYGEIVSFLKDSNETQMLLNAPAGTGKTYLITYLINDLITKNICKKIAITSPTHKSKQILISKLNEINNNPSPSIEISTIHRLLHYKSVIDLNGNKIFQKDSKTELNWYIYDLIIIDECSMLSEGICNDIFNEIEKQKNNKKTKKMLKILYSGDMAQLNPIDEKISCIFSKSIKLITLNNIVRTKNYNIMKFSEDHRIWQLDNTKQPILSNYLDENIKIYRNKDEWLDHFIKCLENKTNNVILVWTNKQCNEYNTYIRKKIFKKDVLEKYEIGELLVFNNYFRIFEQIDDNHLETINFYTSEQVILTNISVVKHKLKKLSITKTKVFSEELNNKIIGYLERINNKLDININVYMMMIKKINESTEYNVMVVHDDSIKMYDKLYMDCSNIIIKIKEACYKSINKVNLENMELCNYQQEIDRKITKLWNNFNSVFEIFGDLSYSYSISCHKSQGSGYFDTYIDIRDIFQNKNESERLKMLYTAITRTSNSINIYV